jgi:hypothetical protein
VKYIIKAIKDLEILITISLGVIFSLLFYFDLILLSLLVLFYYVIIVISLSIMIHHDEKILQEQDKMEKYLQESLRNKNKEIS